MVDRLEGPVDDDAVGPVRLGPPAFWTDSDPVLAAVAARERPGLDLDGRSVTGHAYLAARRVYPIGLDRLSGLVEVEPAQGAEEPKRDLACGRPGRVARGAAAVASDDVEAGEAARAANADGPERVR